MDYTGIQLYEFIVGQGKHSEDGEAKVKNAVIDLLTRCGIRYEIPINNAGMIRVSLEDIRAVMKDRR